VLEAERQGRRRTNVTIKIKVPMDKVELARTEDGYVAQLMLFLAALDRNGGRSDVPRMPLAMVTKERPAPGETVTYETTIELARRTTRLTAALFDMVGNRTLISTVTREQADEQLGN
jgi:hypothetical protein